MSKDEAILLCVNKQVVWASQHIHVGIHSYMANMVRKKLNDLSYSYLLLTMIRQTTREVIGGGGEERLTATSLTSKKRVNKLIYSDIL